MKSHFWNLVKCFVFAGIVLCMVHAIYGVLKWKDTIGGYLSSVEQFYATDEGLIDVVFLGSSHCYCGIYPPILWQEYGMASFDMSVSGQDKNSAYHDLVELYKTQKPSVIYVDLYALLFDEHQVESNLYRNYLSLRPSPNSVALVNKYFEGEEKKDYLLRFPILHTRYRELQKYDFLPYKVNDFGRGENYNFSTGGSWINLEALYTPTVGQLSEKNLRWLNDLALLARDNGSEMEFIVIPFAVSEAEQEILNAAEQALTAAGFDYTDFNKKTDEMGIILNYDFSDAFHLNVYGAEKLTQYLGGMIREKYSLEDHRGDGRYHQWEDDLRWYRNEKIKQRMRTTTDLYEFTDLMTQFTDGVTVISLEGDFLNSPVNYYEIFESLGMDHEEYLAGGKWIYRDGGLQKVLENDEGQQAAYIDLSRYDGLKIAYNGAFEPTNIMIGGDGFQKRSCLTFVTYDTFLEEIVTNLLNF